MSLRKSHWAPKGSYRLQPILESNYAKYILNDYSVHIKDEVRKALLAKGYILVVIGGYIIGDLQWSHFLKQKYQMLKAELMLEMLPKDQNKNPSQLRDENMKLLKRGLEILTRRRNVEEVLKQNFLIFTFDCSKDFRVSKKLYSL